MHPALLKLLRLRVVGFFRRFATRGSTAKKVVGGVLAVFVVFSWIGPAIIASTVRHRETMDPERVLAVAPLILALFVTIRIVVATGSASLAFSPAEMDYLFPGPFTRRQLLLYKLAGGMAGAVLLAVIFNGQVRHVAASWVSGYVSILMSFVLMQLLGVAIALGRQRLGQSLFGRFTMGLGVVVLGGLALAAWPSLKGLFDSSAGPPDLAAILPGMAQRIHDSTFARVVLSPFEVFTRILVSPPGLVFFGWIAAAAAILGGLLALVFRLDAAYAEVAIAVSAKLASRVEMSKRRGFGMPVSATFSLPAFPWAGGAGPIAWRQMLAAARNYKAILFFVVLMGGISAFMISLNKNSDVPVRALLIPMLLPVYLVLMNALRFDFRSDLEHMDILKTLPARPAMIALGQLLTPTFLMVVLVGGAVVAIHTISEHGLGTPSLVSAILLALAPGAAILCALENIVFLVLPTRTPGGSAADMNTMLRYIAVRFLKLLMLIPCGAAVGAVAGVTWMVTKSPTASYAAGWMVLTLLAITSVWGMAYAFRRFDPSRDMPA